jgi:hypothetical protein
MPRACLPYALVYVQILTQLDDAKCDMTNSQEVP